MDSLFDSWKMDQQWVNYSSTTFQLLWKIQTVISTLQGFCWGFKNKVTSHTCVAHSRSLRIITSFPDVDTIITLGSVCRQAPQQLWWQSSVDAVILATLHLEVIWPQNTSSDVSGFHAYDAHTVTLHMSESTVKEGTRYMLTLEKDKCLSHKAFTRRWSSALYVLHPVHPICEYAGLWLEDLRSFISSSKNHHILEYDQSEVFLMVAAWITMTPATLETSDTGVGRTSSNLGRSESFLQNLELLSIPNQSQWRRCNRRSQWGLRFPQKHNAALLHYRKMEQVCREPNQQPKIELTNKQKQKELAEFPTEAQFLSIDCFWNELWLSWTTFSLE